jgi:hypothetical protein
LSNRSRAQPAFDADLDRSRYGNCPHAGRLSLRDRDHSTAFPLQLINGERNHFPRRRPQAMSSARMARSRLPLRLAGESACSSSFTRSLSSQFSARTPRRSTPLARSMAPLPPNRAAHCRPASRASLRMGDSRRLMVEDQRPFSSSPARYSWIRALLKIGTTFLICGLGPRRRNPVVLSRRLAGSGSTSPRMISLSKATSRGLARRLSIPARTFATLPMI